MEHITQLREQRFKHRVSQWELARKAGLHQSRISLIEKGYVKPSKNELKKIVLFFEKLDEIFYAPKP
jgi:predicted transcriptional regulator